MDVRNPLFAALLFLCGISWPATASFSAPAVVPPSSQTPAQGIRAEAVGASVIVVQSATPAMEHMPRGREGRSLPMIHVVRRTLALHTADRAGLPLETVQSYRIISFE